MHIYTQIHKLKHTFKSIFISKVTYILETISSHLYLYSNLIYQFILAFCLLLCGLWRKLGAEELMLLNCGVGEDSWESLYFKEVQPVHPKRNQSWIFIAKTDAEAETPILWPPDVKNWLIGKKPWCLGRIKGRRRRGRQRMSWLDAITDSVDMSWRKL